MYVRDQAIPNYRGGLPKNVRGGQAPARRYREMLAARRARAWCMFGIRRSRTTEEASSTVGRGPVPRHAPVSPKNVRGGQAPARRYREMLAARRARTWCMFGIRRSRTTEESSQKTFAGDRPRATFLHGGQAPALRYREILAARTDRDRFPSSYGLPDAFISCASLNCSSRCGMPSARSRKSSK